MKWVGDKWLIESTGRRLSGGANDSLGLGSYFAGSVAYTREERPLILCSGYDHELYEVGPHVDKNAGTPLTPEERAEVADFMIARWQRWKERGR